MEILIVDQCSSRKSYPDESAVFDAAEIDKAGLEELRKRDESICLPARKLYAGRQQKYINEAVDTLRADGHDVDRYFVSAGFGFVTESEELPPYDVTFTDMTKSEIESRAATLEVGERASNVISSEAYDLVFFALGSDYYRAINLPEILSVIPKETISVTFNQEEVADQYANVISIPARTEQAKEQETIVIALKGVYLKNFADHLTNGMKIESADEILPVCTEKQTDQTHLSDFRA